MGSYLSKIGLAPILAVAFVLVFALGPARTAGATVLNCESTGIACSQHKVDFGVDRIFCVRDSEEAATQWLCQYEAGYVCTNEDTGDKKSGGFLPVLSQLCEHLCGKCSSKWK